MKSFSIFILFSFLVVFLPKNSLAQDAYDVCSGAIFLDINAECNPETFSFENNTNGADECNEIGVWFAVIVPASGNVTFSTLSPGSNIDTEIKAYAGSCASLILLSDDCQDEDNTFFDYHESIYITGRTPGESIYFVVDDRGDGGTFSVCAIEETLAIQVPGDDCANATPIFVGETCNSEIYTFEFATGEIEGSDECENVGVWFHAIVPASGNIIFTTLPPGSNGDTEIKAYAGSCGSFTLLSEDCQDNDNTSYGYHEQITITGRTPGESIYFVVDDRGEGGTFSACAYSPLPCEVEPSKFSVNFDNSLANICGDGSLSIIGSQGTYQADPLLMDETVYCFGEDDGLMITNEIMSCAGEYTIELYFKFDDFNSYQRIIDFSDGNLDEGLYSNGDQLYFYDYSENNPSVFTSTSEYYHVVLTYSNFEFVLYVDGVLYETISDDENIGFNPESFTFFKDDEDEDVSGCVRMINIYNYVVTPAMVSEMALAPTAEDCPLVANAIPTMSQWGIILLSLMILIFGIVALKQKRVTFS